MTKHSSRDPNGLQMIQTLSNTTKEFTRGLFNTAALTPVAWLAIVALALCIIPIDFIRKAVSNRKKLARA